MMNDCVVKIGDMEMGDSCPCYVIAEIGINHNGDLALAKRLIDSASEAGCDAVKFQKRTPDICVPEEQKSVMRETPWGYISYLEYREKVEFSKEEYQEIDRYCKDKEIAWFSSCWDSESIEFMEAFEPVAYKIPSACITDQQLLKRLIETGRPLICSSGMSTMDEVRAAYQFIRENGKQEYMFMHTTSTYPCPPSELNLRMIQTLKDNLDCPVGYSGHEVGLQTTLAAVALGAAAIERHITLDRTMWGTDQSASVEPQGLKRLVRDIRVIEEALGDGVKRVYDSEMPIRKKLRK